MVVRVLVAGYLQMCSMQLLFGCYSNYGGKLAR